MIVNSAGTWSAVALNYDLRFFVLLFVFYILIAKIKIKLDTLA